ncbi:MAG: hypothetical protein DMG26_21310, partial [Acidobacteria bacterium]
LMKKRYGEEWILSDIEKGSRIVQSVTGARPKYLRPPDWDIWDEMEKRIESQGYHVMTKSSAVPSALRDVDSED